jgi:DUF4097 and DUF4098 domain-containing protein YvlB
MTTRTINTLTALLFLLFFSIPSETLSEDVFTGFQTKSFTVTKGGLFEVSTSVGDVRITSWDKNEVFVKISAHDDDDLDDFNITQHENTITVEYHSDWGWTNDIRIEATIPNQFNVDIETSGGDIELGNDVNGNLKGETSGGDIKLGNIGGTIEMSTSGGDIRSGDIQGDVTLSTSGGDIVLGVVSGETDVSTSGGDIRIKNVGKSLRAHTAGGEVKIGDVGGQASITTYGGDIQVDNINAQAQLTTAGGDIILREASGSVKAKTAGGDIRLKNVTGEINAKTAAGDISAELRSSPKSSCRLTTAAGDITFSVSETAKLTINARVKIFGWWHSSKDGYDIHSDFKADKLDADRDKQEIRAVYKINGGGENVSLETSMGSIEIRKLKK